MAAVRDRAFKEVVKLKRGPRGGARILYDWCPCEKRRLGHRHGEEGDTARGWLAASQAGRLRKKPTLPTPGSKASGLRNCEKTNVCAQAPESVLCYGSWSCSSHVNVPEALILLSSSLMVPACTSAPGPQDHSEAQPLSPPALQESLPHCHLTAGGRAGEHRPWPPLLLTAAPGKAVSLSFLICKNGDQSTHWTVSFIRIWEGV